MAAAGAAFPPGCGYPLQLGAAAARAVPAQPLPVNDLPGHPVQGRQLVRQVGPVHRTQLRREREALRERANPHRFAVPVAEEKRSRVGCQRLGEIPQVQVVLGEEQGLPLQEGPVAVAGACRGGRPDLGETGADDFAVERQVDGFGVVHTATPGVWRYVTTANNTGTVGGSKPFQRLQTSLFRGPFYLALR